MTHTSLATLSNRPPNRWWKLVEEIGEQEQKLKEMDDRARAKRSLSLRFAPRAASRWCVSCPRHLPVREAAVRTMQMRHFDVQMLGGIALFHGRIAEMDTGEGKTLTATLAHVPACPGRQRSTSGDRQ